MDHAVCVALWREVQMVVGRNYVLPASRCEACVYVSGYWFTAARCSFTVCVTEDGFAVDTSCVESYPRYCSLWCVPCLDIECGSALPADYIDPRLRLDLEF